jgi:N utilization substance protein B
MSTRRDTREWILQILFLLDMNPEENLEKVFGPFWEEHHPDPKAREFVEQSVRGIQSRLPEIDERLMRYAENWALDRMGGVERNVMRMAIHEMLYRTDIPPVVSINEAVDVAKYFSSDESGRFVNGILDRVRKDLDRPAREAVPNAP